MKLSPPWVTFYHKINALFEEDDQVRVVFEEEVSEIKIYVESAVKAEAIQAILPAEKEFGGVTVRITVIPANEQSTASLIRTAFDGNPALSCIKTVSTPVMGEVNYVVFAKKVVQFFNDDLTDLNGNTSTLYQEIAKDVIDAGTGVFFCTEEKDGFDRLFGE